MIKDIINSDGLITIYTDGSAHDNGMTGSAYVIESQGEDDHYVTSHGEDLGPEMRSASFYAETMAIAYALEDMPENSNILIKTDADTLAFFIEKPEISRTAVLDGMKESKLLQGLQRLNNAIQRHNDVDAIYISHKKTSSYQELRMTRMAHNAAAEEAGVQSSKHLPHRDREIENSRPTAKSDFAESLRSHDFTGTNDVIDIKADGDTNTPHIYSSGNNDPQPY